jgi:GNAT superfamily N-acetyltransferase
MDTNQDCQTITPEILLAMDVRIRNARPDDLDTLTALLGDLFSIEADFEVDTPRQRRGLALMLDGCQKHRCVKVAETLEGVVGMVTGQLVVSTAEGGMVVLVEDMVVDRLWRKRGIGRLLMESMEAWARQRDASRLQLLADRTNFAALDFYDKIGWRPTRLICLRRKWNKSG